MLLIWVKDASDEEEGRTNNNNNNVKNTCYVSGERERERVYGDAHRPLVTSTPLDAEKPGYLLTNKARKYIVYTIICMSCRSYNI